MEHEYVVIWYDRQFKTKGNADDSIVYVGVELANLTEPTYSITDRETQELKEFESIIKVDIPLNYLHKLPIGSIWKNGRSKQYFDLPRYQGIQVTSDNYEIQSIAKATNYEQRRLANLLEPDEPECPPPFDYKNYYERIYEYDKNQLIIVHHDNQKYVIHPLLLFNTHYGYSMDIKRIITKYSRNTVKEKLIPTNTYLDRLAKEQGCEEYVIIPRGMTQRDAVFLYHYKYNKAVQLKVDKLNDAIYNVKIDNKKNIRVDFWNLPTTLNLKGIKVGDSIFCTAITGISEPLGEPINILLEPKKSASMGGEKATDFITVVPFTPPQNIEELDLDFVRDPVNNIVVKVLMERLERIGELRRLNAVRLNGDDKATADFKYLEQPNAENFGVGDRRGWAGATGLAQCFFSPADLPKSHFDTVWRHAKEYAEQVGSVAYWYTPLKGLHNNLVDENGNEIYWVLDLNELDLAISDVDPPTHAMVIWIAIDNMNYYIIDFGRLTNNGPWKPAKSMAYRADDDENFLYEKEGLVSLLLSVFAQNGGLDSDFVDRYYGKVATYIHRDGRNNNWVRNGIEKLRFHS